MQKTEIIPIGHEDYQRRVQDTRSTGEGDNQEQIPENMHIVKEGEPVQILGAWVGNGIDQEHVWAPMIEKLTTLSVNGKRVAPQSKDVN